MDRFKFRVWNKQNNRYIEEDIYQTQDAEFFMFDKVNSHFEKIDGVDIEKHTGLYDTKNYDVYEGDIVKDNQGRIAIVRWSITWCEYELKWIKNNTGSCPEFWEWIFDKGYGIEVIGNIHENKDLLEDK